MTKLLPSQQPGKSYVAVFVPASDLAPHRSEKDKRYYRRSGESFYTMEHYEVADMFGRRAHPVLQLVGLLRRSGFRREGCTFELTVCLRNIGRRLAQFPSLEIIGIHQDLVFNSYGIDGNFHFGLTPAPSAHKKLFRGNTNEVVHPNETLPVFKVKLTESVNDAENGHVDRELRARIAADGSPLATHMLRVPGAQLDELGRAKSEPEQVQVVGERVDGEMLDTHG